MNSLIACALECLQRGEAPPVEVMERLGAPDPPKASEALRRAAGHPELAASRSSWGPALLLSARPGGGAQRLDELAVRARELMGEPLDISRMPSLALVLGSSEFLGRLLLENPNWALDLVGDPPPPPNTKAEMRTFDEIREAKYRGLLRIAARELLGCPLQESLVELSGLADRCLDAALERAAEETGLAAPAMMALGTLGGQELSISADVDLLFVRPDGSRSEEADEVVSLLVQELERRVSTGLIYRVGMHLAPAGEGALSHALSDAVSDYMGRADDAVRHLLLRARPIAGSFSVALRFIREVSPLVYGGRAPAPREAGSWLPSGGSEWDLLAGPGGIREIEWRVQRIQLDHGAEDPTLRTGNVLDALASLVDRRLIDDRIARDLSDAYTWLRRAEHFLQLVDEAPTHAFPQDGAGQLALARCMGYREPEADTARSRLLEDWEAVRREVVRHRL